MDFDAGEMKSRLLREIEEKSPVFRRSSGYQYSIRCPFCGDSQKDLRATHMYLKCTPDPTEPILYKCFKCDASGRVNDRFLGLLGIDPSKYPTMNRCYNRLPTVDRSRGEMITGTPDLTSPQVIYIEERLGPGFSLGDYSKFKIVWDMNRIRPYVSDRWIRDSLPDNETSVSFVSDNRSSILTRVFDPNSDVRWRKTKLFPDEARSFYTISADLSMFEPAVINIAEGIFDILSIYRNFPSGENSMYTACLGKDYISALDYAIAMGLVGGNVSVRIYADSDVNRKYLANRLKKYRWIFDSIVIRWNVRDKDFGITPDRILVGELKV